MEVRGLRIAARLGVTPEERRVHQPLEVDLVLGYDVEDAVTEDRIDATVDYSAVAEAVVAWAADRETALIETLGAALADYVLTRSPRLETVSVALRKFPLPRAAAVEFRIERSRT
ncbi:MAG: dihydroneopterin aldolase [Spirochaetaceae bacterium]